MEVQILHIQEAHLRVEVTSLIIYPVACDTNQSVHFKVRVTQS